MEGNEREREGGRRKSGTQIQRRPHTQCQIFTPSRAHTDLQDLIKGAGGDLEDSKGFRGHRPLESHLCRKGRAVDAHGSDVRGNGPRLRPWNIAVRVAVRFQGLRVIRVLPANELTHRGRWADMGSCWPIQVHHDLFPLARGQGINKVNYVLSLVRRLLLSDVPLTNPPACPAKPGRSKSGLVEV